MIGNNNNKLKHQIGWHQKQMRGVLVCSSVDKVKSLEVVGRSIFEALSS